MINKWLCLLLGLGLPEQAIPLLWDSCPLIRFEIGNIEDLINLLKFHVSTCMHSVCVCVYLGEYDMRVSRPLVIRHVYVQKINTKSSRHNKHLYSLRTGTYLLCVKLQLVHVYWLAKLNTLLTTVSKSLH